MLNDVRGSKITMLLVVLSHIITSLVSAQEHVTMNPRVDRSYCALCKVTKVIIDDNSTRVQVSIPARKGVGATARFSRWIILLPYPNEINIEDLRRLDLNIPDRPLYADAYTLASWERLADERRKMQDKVSNAFGEILIKDLGAHQLDVRYNIKGDPGESFSFWLTFDKIPPGYEEIMIIELVENGFEWLGVKINNPDTYPTTNWDELKLRMYWESKGIRKFEGIYEHIPNESSNSTFKLALKFDSTTSQPVLVYLAESSGRVWQSGEVKAFLTPTASPNIFKAKWYLPNKKVSEDLYIVFEENSMKVIWSNGTPTDIFLKLYPTAETDPGIESIGASKASGTGFAIDEKGLIVTNSHVVEGAKKITVKGIQADFSKSFEAKVVAVDKNNDLAILKITDLEFKGTGALPFIISNKMSEVGTNIYTLGYPLRTTMGNEVKLSTGVISSKTGFQGDITTYQVSAPVQPGSSGGPLFDDKGNVIGIINAKHAGAENVSYAIKSSYLFNLIQSMDVQPNLPKVNSVAGKSLPDQVRLVKNLVYIIEVE